MAGMVVRVAASTRKAAEAAMATAQKAREARPKPEGDLAVLAAKVDTSAE